MTPAKPEQNGDGSEGAVFGIKAKTIAFLVNKVGLPSLVVLTFLGGGLYYMPNYLERQSDAVDKMADAFKDIASAETEIKLMVGEIKEACKETRDFQKVVTEDHRVAKKEREQMLDDHKRIMAELIGKQ